MPGILSQALRFECGFEDKILGITPVLGEAREKRAAEI